MIIIKFLGGLGNQMFLYGLYYTFSKKGIETKIDLSHFEKEKNHNGFEIEKIFSLKLKYSTRAQNLLFSKTTKLLYWIGKHPYKENFTDQYTYNPKVSEVRFGYLKGYWQSEKYFSDFSVGLSNEFKFPALTDEKNKKLSDEIIETSSVSIHIRRGDYLLSGRNFALDLNYYNEAIKYIQQRVTNPVFYVFSDDMQWVRENFDDQTFVAIDWNQGNNSYLDMQLMSLCKHNIIANSSFSWWGAWLNPNPDKIVIAPAKWMPHHTGSNDLIPESWIRINNSF